MGALRTGGQGSVYKGRRIGPIITAVKLLPTPIHTESIDDKNYRNFKSEVEKLKKVNEEPNPNVVKILNYGITESGSFPYIEMEFIEGPDLEELLKPPHDGVFIIREVIKLADQLASALAHCHKLSVKHGDIKSNNVKFNIYTNNYVLLDFGLSVMSDEQRRSSIRHAGAIEFMAPEQNEGQMLFQTDIYSYGIILYELLSGQVPFPLRDQGETSRNAVMLAHMESQVPDVMELRKNNLPATWSEEKARYEMQVPAWLLHIVSKCLEKSPDKRYSNGMELQDAIIVDSLEPMKNNATGGPDFYALQKENERLQALALFYQESEANKAQEDIKPIDGRRGIRLSKPIFILLLIGFIGLSAFSSYVLYKGYARRIYHHFFGTAKAKLPDTSSKINPQVNTKEGQQLLTPVDTARTDSTDEQKEEARRLADSVSLRDSIKKDTSGNLKF
jgi:serine/threonine protein kinase